MRGGRRKEKKKVKKNEYCLDHVILLLFFKIYQISIYYSKNSKFYKTLILTP